MSGIVASNLIGRTVTVDLGSDKGCQAQIRAVAFQDSETDLPKFVFLVEFCSDHRLGKVDSRHCRVLI